MGFKINEIWIYAAFIYFFVQFLFEGGKVRAVYILKKYGKSNELSKCCQMKNINGEAFSLTFIKNCKNDDWQNRNFHNFF